MTPKIKILAGGDLGRPANHISIQTSVYRPGVYSSNGTEKGSCHFGAGLGRG